MTRDKNYTSDRGLHNYRGDTQLLENDIQLNNRPSHHFYVVVDIGYYSDSMMTRESPRGTRKAILEY